MMIVWNRNSEQYESIESWECDLHNISGVVANDKVSISLQIFGLWVHLSTGVMGVTFELLVHRSQKVLNIIQRGDLLIKN